MSYKLGDAAGRLDHIFTASSGIFFGDVGSINKALGLAASIIGAIYGGVIVYRFGLYRSLLYFGVLQALTNLGFFALSLFEKLFWIGRGYWPRELAGEWVSCFYCFSYEYLQ